MVPLPPDKLEGHTCLSISCERDERGSVSSSYQTNSPYSCCCDLVYIGDSLLPFYGREGHRPRKSVCCVVVRPHTTPSSWTMFRGPSLGAVVRLALFRDLPFDLSLIYYYCYYG